MSVSTIKSVASLLFATLVFSTATAKPKQTPDEEVRQAFQLVTEEARKSFGNPAIFMEKFLVEPKHIEVQILADGHGNIVHLYERDCSLQRRYQKVVEFPPAFSVPESTLEKLRNEAVKLAKEVGYVSVGTVEFLVDKDNNHYFIEMNPRIQVEHTVTEMVTGIDIVGMGHKLPDFIGSKCENWCHKTSNGIENRIHCGLCCTTGSTLFCFYVESVL